MATPGTNPQLDQQYANAQKIKSGLGGFLGGIKNAVGGFFSAAQAKADTANATIQQNAEAAAEKSGINQPAPKGSTTLGPLAPNNPNANRYGTYLQHTVGATLADHAASLGGISGSANQSAMGGGGGGQAKVPPPPSGAIDTSSYQPNAQPLNTNPSSNTADNYQTTINAAMTLAKSTYDSANSLLTTLQNQNQALAEKYSKVSDPTDQAAIQQQQDYIQQQQQVITDAQGKLNSYNQQLADLTSAMDNEMAAVQGQQGIPQGIISGQQINIQNKYAAKMAGLSAEASVQSSIIQSAQGNQANAYKSITTAASLMNFNVTQQKDNLATFMNNNQSQISLLSTSQQNALKQAFSELDTMQSQQYSENLQKLTFAVQNGLPLTASDLQSMSLSDVAAYAAKTQALLLGLPPTGGAGGSGGYQTPTPGSVPTSQMPPAFAQQVRQAANGMPYIDISSLPSSQQAMYQNLAPYYGVLALDSNQADAVNKAEQTRQSLQAIQSAVDNYSSSSSLGQAFKGTWTQALMSNPFTKSFVPTDATQINAFRSAFINAVQAIGQIPGSRVSNQLITKVQEADFPTLNDTKQQATVKLNTLVGLLNDAESQIMGVSSSGFSPNASGGSQSSAGSVGDYNF